MTQSVRRQGLDAAADALGVTMRDPALLRIALTHPSASDKSRTVNNQRLEFLGDRVLGLVVAEKLYDTYPDEDEGDLARRFAALVSASTLTDVARRIGLGAHLRLGAGEEASDGRDNPANLADACEALIGALFLDSGLDAARGFIEHGWKDMIAGQTQPPRDPKTELQEWTQARGLGLPRYKLVSQTGPAHAPGFVVAVHVAGQEPESGAGRSKRAAEHKAAAAMVARLVARPSGDGDDA